MLYKLPNFFIVGAAKSGTTALYYYLKQHPEIYMSPIKEPNYFAKDINVDLFREDYKREALIDTKKYFSKSKLKELHLAFITNFEDYLQLFREVNNEKAIGECSNSYLYSKVAAKEIRKLIPNVKIIMILRNPIERAYSHYLMNLRDGRTSEKDFIKEVLADFNKSYKGWGISHLYIELGLYYEQVKRYLESFPRQNVKIILYENFKNYPEEILKEIFEFLNVDKNYLPNLGQKYNVSAIPKYPKFNQIVKKVYIRLKSFIPEKISNNLKKKYKDVFLKRKKRPLSMGEKQILLEYFKDDIEKLSKLINKDLSIWLNN